VWENKQWYNTSYKDVRAIVTPAGAVQNSGITSTTNIVFRTQDTTPYALQEHGSCCFCNVDKKCLDYVTRSYCNSVTGTFSAKLSCDTRKNNRDAACYSKIGACCINGTCVECDSTQNWSYFTCATVTETKNADGTTTTIYDYGTGCDEYGSLMKGKITYIWKNEGSSYESKVIYDHFYSYGTEINGYSENNFTSDGNSYFEYSNSGASDGGVAGGVVGGDSISYPEIAFNWSGTNISKEVLTITADDGKKYNYDSENSTKWDNSTYTVLTGVYNYYSNTEDYEYHYLVSKPLVTNYECSLSWVPVSGVEKTTSIKSGMRNELIINYGNGECDNYALVTNNGKTTKIDLSEWFNMSNDSTVSNTNVVKGKIRRK
jgi:hypothetical protein